MFASCIRRKPTDNLYLFLNEKKIVSKFTEAFFKKRQIHFQLFHVKISTEKTHKNHKNFPPDKLDSIWKIEAFFLKSFLFSSEKLHPKFQNIPWSWWTKIINNRHKENEDLSAEIISRQSWVPRKKEREQKDKKTTKTTTIWIIVLINPWSPRCSSSSPPTQAPRKTVVYLWAFRVSVPSRLQVCWSLQGEIRWNRYDQANLFRHANWNEQITKCYLAPINTTTTANTRQAFKNILATRNEKVRRFQASQIITSSQTCTKKPEEG